MLTKEKDDPIHGIFDLHLYSPTDAFYLRLGWYSNYVALSRVCCVWHANED